MIIRNRIQDVYRWFWRVAKKVKWGAPEAFRVKIPFRSSVSVVKRYSDLHPNSKLRGEVYRCYDLGPNIVVEQGRQMFAGLICGCTAPPVGGFITSMGFNELGGANLGYVIRGMALGDDNTPETDTDTALVSPINNPAIGHHYHEIDSIDFSVGAGDTYAEFRRTFSTTEPQAALITIEEYGLYSASPGGGAEPPITTPPGPAGGHFMVARKTYGPITKDTNFTLEVRWKIEF